MIVTNERISILMFVDNPFYTTVVSDVILERISPVLVSSKNGMSLFII